MSEFFAEYGLWLLIALLVVIVVMFLLTGRKRDAAGPVEAERVETGPAETGPVEAKLVEATPPSPPVAIPPAVKAAAPAPPAPEPLADLPPAAPVESIQIPVSPAVAAVPEAVTPEPAPEPAPTPAVTASPDRADNLLLLKGVGPKLATLLGTLGVTSFAQIAAWTDADIAAVDDRLGNFKGRPVRDQWIDQAKLLAAGDTAGFEARYGKL